MACEKAAVQTHRLRGHDIEAAEGSAGESSVAGLELGDGLVAALGVQGLRFRGHCQVETKLGRNYHHVGRHTVPRHAVLALLDRAVETEVVLLSDAVEHDLVGHGCLDRAARAKTLGEVVTWPSEACVGGSVADKLVWGWSATHGSRSSRT